jgi:4-hydroxy-tetrahydrodipicolinate synthase
MISWQGVYPAVTTNFDSQGNLDIDAFKKKVKLILEAGVHGFVLGGTLGESSSLDDDEKESLFFACKEIVGQSVPIIMNISESSTKRAQKTCKHFHNLGVDGFMLLPPLRYPSDEIETTTFLLKVAEMTDKGIMLYNNPIDYRTELTMSILENCAKYPQFQAIKESTRDIRKFTKCRSLLGNRYKILCGVDNLAYEELLLGADGWVAGLVTAFPHETVQIYNWIKNKEIEKAKTMYYWFLPLLELDVHVKLVQYIKLAESYTGTGTEYVREPRLLLSGVERAEIKAVIETALKAKKELRLS